MRKFTLGLAVMASLGLGALATPASALPGSPSGVSAADTVSPVMHRGGMHRGGMHHHGMRPRHHHHHMMMRPRHRHHHRM